jgi:UDP-glucose 4-epimerase
VPFLTAGVLSPAVRRAAVIYYLASSINPALAERHPERAEADHALFLGLLGALRALGTRPTLVLTSTAGAMYDAAVPPPYAETSPAWPGSAYGRAKLRLEEALSAHRDAVRPVIFRIANTYGPGQPAAPGQGVLAHWLEAAAGGRPLYVYGDPAVCRDYIHVDDVTAALVRAHHFFGTGHPDGPAVFNLASGRPVSLAALLAVVRETVGPELTVNYVPGRPFDGGDVWFDVRRIQATIGWRPRVGLEDGVRRMWQVHQPAALRQ